MLLLINICKCAVSISATFIELLISPAGGKDSTVLAYVMKLLNDRYNYGLKLVLLSVDEGITGKQEVQLRLGSVVNQVKKGHIRGCVYVKLDESCILCIY